MTEQVKTTRRLMRMIEVIRMTGLSRSSIYDRMNAGQFPKSVSLGCRSVAWVEAEVDDWVENQIAQRDELAA
ncbi:helix-turn-helix transcriptional regulator [Vibrio proteolyticus]|uniref:Putative AlpA family transcriptional regulator n=1 Tax=Vibrio proteolyticus NBRC 13287 TaxID=1219065 RepID=U3A6C0_VIBPR|nr:AlpA family transcriptional regulator [Vibrio proteolyticus]GAD68852.1 putative AlpA family transcriptional regulator [Vibrio proteolyticus NBRC 13287]